MAGEVVQNCKRADRSRIRIVSFLRHPNAEVSGATRVRAVRRHHRIENGLNRLNTKESRQFVVEGMIDQNLVLFIFHPSAPLWIKFFNLVQCLGEGYPSRIIRRVSIR